MPRLSVSLGEEQMAWIEDRAAEFDVSKGKVVRECIDDVRTDDSLFTTQVNNSSTDIENRLTALESRFEQLEARLQAESGTAVGPTAAGSDTAQQQSAPGNTADASQEQAASPEDGRAPPDTDSESRSVVATDSPTDTTATVAPSSDQSERAARPQQSSDVPDAGEHDQPSTETTRDSPPGADRPDSTTADAQSTDSATSEAQPGTGPRDAGENEARPPDSEQLDKSDPEGIRAYLNTKYADDRAAAVFACWELLEERGTAHIKAFKEFHEVHSLAHDDDDEWWTEGVKPILESLPGVMPPEPGGSFYRFKY